MDPSAKKQRLRFEPEKVRRTSHWDLDYLPLKEVEALYAQGNRRASKKGGSRRTWPMSKAGLGLLLMIAGAALFAAAVLLGRYLSAA